MEVCLQMDESSNILIMGRYWGCISIMEKKMETIMIGVYDIELGV